jgi:AraC family transcriptional regulator
MNLKLPTGRFYGNTLRTKEVAGFGLSETIYPPYSTLPRHSHERPYFGLILRGTYIENYGKKTRVCKPLMLVYHTSDEDHSQRFYQSEVRLFRIEVCPQRLERLDESLVAQRKSVDFHGNIACRLAARLYYEFREIDEVSPLVIEGLALEIMGEVLRRSQRSSRSLPPRWLKQARELIHARVNESLALSQIAQTVGVHPVYLAREFRRHYRSTIGEYIRQLRIESACREMLKPDASLAEIAVACGFHDQSHFSKAFKRVMNTTPAKYRARFRSH